jgi:hypothetical protein
MAFRARGSLTMTDFSIHKDTRDIVKDGCRNEPFHNTQLQNLWWISGSKQSNNRPRWNYIRFVAIKESLSKQHFQRGDEISVAMERCLRAFVDIVQTVFKKGTVSKACFQSGGECLEWTLQDGEFICNTTPAGDESLNVAKPRCLPRRTRVRQPDVVAVVVERVEFLDAARGVDEADPFHRSAIGERRCWMWRWRMILDEEE